MGSLKYRRDVDGLRAVAILSVVGFHAFPSLMPGGFVGVDVFFVISGFLISSIIISSLGKDSFSFIEFYARRIKRIFPALLLVLVVCYTLGWFVLLAEEYKQLGKHIAGGAGFISNFLFWNESGYFDSLAERKPLLHLWSLGIEEQFYIIWPLLLYCSYKRRSWLLSLVFLLAVISFSVNVIMVRSDAAGVFYSPVTRFWELMIGSALAYFTLHKQDVSLKAKQCIGFACLPVFNGYSWVWSGTVRRNVKSLAGFFLIISAVIFLNKGKTFPGWWALLPTIGTYLIISAGSVAWLNRTVLSNRALVWFGLISFPLYLWHWPALVFAYIAESGVPNVEIRIAVVLVSVALSWLTHRMIENPIRYGRKCEVTKVITLCLLMMVIGIVGYSTYKSDGFGFRYPGIITQLTAAKFDITTEWREHICSLEPAVDKHTFPAECIEKNKRPLVILWGDSHAAALYPGIKALRDKYDFGIGQITTSGCPPLLSFVEGNPEVEVCMKINWSSLDLIKKYKPDVVLLHANWNYYYDYKVPDAAVKEPRNASYEVSQLNISVQELKKIGVPHIIIIGPVPQWRDSLPSSILAYWKNDPLHRIPPIRMRYGLKDSVLEVESHMRHISELSGIEYISAYQAMCDQNGCLVRDGEDSLAITTFDYGHLSPSGSKFLMSAIAGSFLPVSLQAF